MTFLHTGDLHLGKRQNEIDRAPDQREILDAITEICRQRKPDALLICGDVYDAALPPKEAVTMLDDFLCGVSETGTKTLIISGNHDSAERLRFGSRLMDGAGVYIAGETDSLPIRTVTLEDSFGPVRFVMLPFLRRADIRKMLKDFPGGIPDDPAQEFAALLDTLPDYEGRQVILSHQYYLPVSGEVTRCDSESPVVGGLDWLPVSLLSRFDYAALGHIHTPQPVGTANVRYSGSPLKYSASEALTGKSVPLVTLDGDGVSDIELIPLVPKRDVRLISGDFESLIAAAAASDPSEREHYYYVALRGEYPDDAMTRMRYYYPNIMQMSLPLPETADYDMAEPAGDGGKESVSELFRGFYLRQNGREPDDEEITVIDEALEAVGGSGAEL